MIHTPSGHSSGTTDVPTPVVVAYFAIAAAAWLVAAVMLARHLAHDEHHGEGPVPPPNADQIATAVGLALMAGTLWPLTLGAVGIWRAVRHLTAT